ncbi:MAG: type II toxin-antitoxin system VapC family toxin [Bacteroidales bacterium]|nr:type II toxin-antitoxin system VapC family toxin [Bacteroidales bacterium]
METQLVICDTNIFIHWFRNDEATIAKLLQIGTENIIIPSIVKMELLWGCENKKELSILVKKIKKYPVIYIDERISATAEVFIEQFKLSHGLNIPDALIGATAVAYDLPLFTYNLKDFKYLPEIKLLE